MYSGNLHRRLKDLHTKYGPVVRIAPGELSYADAAAWKDIYVHRHDHRLCERNRTWFMKTASDEPHSIMSYDESTHRRFRRAFSHAFSNKSLKDQTSVIEGYVALLMNQLEQSDTSLDLTQWFNFFTFDLASDLSFGESFDCLRDGRAHPWVDVAQNFGRGLALTASINSFTLLGRFSRYLIPRRLAQQGETHRRMSAARAQKRLTLGIDRPDFVTPTKHFSDRRGSMSTTEWEINLAAMVFAASETTASALTAIVRELVQHDEALRALTETVRATFTAESEITVESTSELLYLNAVVSEGLRLAPPVAIGIPRVVPPGGATICGRWVPAGVGPPLQHLVVLLRRAQTYVAFNQYPANRQASNFKHPDSFIPDRFLSPDPETDNMSSFRPFSTGRHSCIGMRLAYAEIRLVLTRLFWAFDVSLADGNDCWDWGEQKTHVLWVCALPFLQPLLVQPLLLHPFFANGKAGEETTYSEHASSAAYLNLSVSLRLAIH
jgi:cytochrome P450